MDKFFYKASLLLGGHVAPDHLKLAFSIFSTYPCAMIFKRIQSKQLKHLFSIVYTTYIMVFLLRLYFGFIHITTIGIISYVLMKYYHGPKVAWINFTLVMLSMSICHIGRQWKGREGDTELDYSGALMIITIKLSSYGFNVLDGRMTNEKLTDHTRQMKIEGYPTLLQYFGWLFYFAGFLAGPSCEYIDYIRLTEEKRVAPLNEWYPALRQFCKSFLFIAGLVFLAPTFNYFQALSPAWSQKSFWYKMLFIQVSAVLTRFKYYCIWYLAEGACILSGAGFNGYDKDGTPLWNKHTNVNVLKCEFAQSYKQLTENWNIGANHWLRHYVYLRFNPPGSGISTLKTYIVSSLWHGFHPGFYMFFMISSSLQVLSRQIRRTVRPLFMSPDGTQPIRYWKSFYDVCTWVVSMGLLNMMVPCFDLLHVPKIMHVWREIYFCHFIIVAIGGAIYFSAKPFLISVQKKRVARYKASQVGVKEGKKEE